LAKKHNFVISEDGKFIDIGHTAQQQYHGGALRISEFAHVVNASVLAGEGMIEALEQTMNAPDFT
jgi:orotidine-5'-phosphate decarboxylase